MGDWDIVNKIKSSIAPESQTVSTNVLRCEVGSAPKQETDILVREEPLEIRVRGHSIAVTMRTPGHDKELAAGFLFTERVICERKQLKDIAPCRSSLEPENMLDVFLASGVEVDFARLTRHVFAASRSEEHTSELQSHSFISYAVF